MKNFKSLLCVVFAFIASTNISQSQISVNSVDVPKPEVQKTKGLKFIEDINFTAAGSGTIENTFQGKTLETSAVTTAPDLTDKLPTPSPEIIEQCGSIQFKYSQMLDIPVETISQSNVYSFVDDWFGTRYRMGGTTKNGVDCSAFAGSLLLGCYALIAPRTAREQHRVSTPVAREDLKEGDLVFFNTTGGISHVGVYLANNYFVHSSCSQGVTISSLNDAYYSKRFVSAGRIDTVETVTEEGTN